MEPSFWGVPIFINKAMQGEWFERTWKERLFSWPWKPWKKLGFNPDANPLIPNGTVYRTPNGFIMNPRTYAALKMKIGGECDADTVRRQ